MKWGDFMKIAMIGQKGIPAESGGIEKHVEEIAKRLVRDGHEVTVYCRPHYSLYESNEYQGIKLIHKHSFNSKHLDAITHTLICSLDTCFKSYDIVHYHAIGPATLSFIPRLAGKKVVVTVHGLDWQRAKWGLLAKLYLKMGERASAFIPNHTIVVSRVLKSYYKKKYGVETSAITNGVSIPEILPAQMIRKLGLNKGKYVLFLARLVPEKGCHHLLEAWKKIDSDKYLVIAGGSSHSDEYVAQLHQDAGDNVIFTGNVKDQLLGELFSNAFLYVLPSEIEGLPISLLEAMSYSLPCLASDIPENVEALGKTGFLFSNQNVVDLTEKMQYLINNPQILMSESEKIFSRVCQIFNWDNEVDKIEKVYRKLLAEH